ncbi:MAG: hypothetical protein ABIW30_07875 [Arenimonas sp.]
MQNFEQIRSAIQGQHMITVRDPYMICVELSLDQGSRHQSIFLAEIEDDDGRKYLRVSTVIAPMTGVDARRMLDFNWQRRVGYMAVGELESVPYLQLCENRPYDSLTASEVDRLILEIGGIGDNLERMLSPDADLL